MYKVVKIGDKEVPMLAMASSDIYYKRLFGEDPLKVVTAQNEGDNTALLFQMGFILAKQAELRDRKRMMALTMDNYIDWLDSMEYGDYIEALDQVAAVYYGNRITSSQEKKVSGQ